MEPDYLEELIEESKKDPAFAVDWEVYEVVRQLVRARMAKGMTQEQVAQAMGVARPRVTELETNPKSATLKRLRAYARAVGVKLTLTVEDAA